MIKSSDLKKVKTELRKELIQIKKEGMFDGDTPVILTWVYIEVIVASVASVSNQCMLCGQDKEGRGTVSLLYHKEGKGANEVRDKITEALVLYSICYSCRDIEQQFMEKDSEEYSPLVKAVKQLDKEGKILHWGDFLDPISGIGSSKTLRSY
ncbi:hypothetical protein LCGC14_0145910 [marine sediment metagenome]|uniref:Uncharacterized protein n=1 Tax=marine sediment metagenome TaxID=412755 RepID=A0A0F9UZU9_9ZZZZ